MAQVRVEETSLTAVADAIRAKTGGTDSLVFPAGYVEAVEGIQAGGSDIVIFGSSANGRVLG